MTNKITPKNNFFASVLVFCLKWQSFSFFLSIFALRYIYNKVSR